MPGKCVVGGRGVEPDAAGAEVAHRGERGLARGTDEPQPRALRRHDGEQLGRELVGGALNRGAEVEHGAVGTEDPGPQQAVGHREVDRRLVALQAREPLEVLALDPRVHAERERGGAREESQRRERRHQCRDDGQRQQPEQHADLRVALDDRGVRQRPVGGESDDALFVRDLVLEGVEGDRGLRHARLSSQAPLASTHRAIAPRILSVRQDFTA